MVPAGTGPATKSKLPDNLSLLPLPPYSPELNPVENIGQFLRQNHLANRVYDDYTAIVDACCDAWNALTAAPPKRSDQSLPDKWGDNGHCVGLLVLHLRRHLPARGVGAALVLPFVSTEAMNLHLAEITTQVAPGAHAVITLDGAGWHRPATN